MDREPFCRHCNYSLVGLTESSRCPECGRPIVEVLERRGTFFPMGKRYVSPVRVFGLPLVHIALGPSDNERRGVARGIIAIGDVAIGFLAIGGVSFGGIALGGMAVGLSAIGGMAIGLLIALGGGAVGGLAVGGGAVGGIAVGGGAAGFVAQGGGAVGVYACGGGAYGRHVITPVSSDPQALRMFDDLAWLLGRSRTSLTSLLRPCAFAVAGTFLLAAMLALIVLVGYALRRRE